MKTRVCRWGNSLAIRIPHDYAADLHLEDNMTVDLILEDGRLILTTKHGPSYSLNELVAGITPDNIHHEVDTGLAQGNEVW